MRRGKGLALGTRQIPHRYFIDPRHTARPDTAKTEGPEAVFVTGRRLIDDQFCFGLGYFILFHERPYLTDRRNGW